MKRRMLAKCTICLQRKEKGRYISTMLTVRKFWGNPLFSPTSVLDEWTAPVSDQAPLFQSYQIIIERWGSAECTSA
jgi:hypothetical protein